MRPMTTSDASGLRIPKPQIHTGPKHMTVDEATSHYLRDAADRVRRQRYWGSGVTALVSDLLDSVATAIDTPEADPTAGERECPSRCGRNEPCANPWHDRPATPPDDDASERLSGDVEALSRLLMEHSAFTGFDACRCGWRAERSGWNPVAHRDHMAAEVSDWLAARGDAAPDAGGRP